MNRGIILLLLFVAVSNAISLKKHTTKLSSFTRQRDTTAALICPGYSCGSSGSTCGPIPPTSYVECPNDFLCNFTNGNGVCSPYANAGGFCTTSNYCVDDTTCVNNVCTTITNTATVGQTCGGAVQCSGFLLCGGAGVCVTLPSTGQDCSVTFACSITSYCRTSNHICTSYFSIPLGGDCDDTDECTAGTACISGMCTAVSASSNKQCSSSLDCNTNEECDCPLSTTSRNATCTAQMTYTQSQATIYTTLYQCIQDNTCTTTVEDCSKCKSSICNYYNKVLLAIQPITSLSCFGSDQLIAFCSSASPAFTATSLFFVILVSLVALL